MNDSLCQGFKDGLMFNDPRGIIHVPTYMNADHQIGWLAGHAMAVAKSQAKSDAMAVQVREAIKANGVDHFIAYEGNAIVGKYRRR